MKQDDRQLKLFASEPPKPRRAKRNIRTKGARIIVRAKWRKEPDVDKIVAALLRIIEDENRKDKKTKRKRAA